MQDTTLSMNRGWKGRGKNDNLRWKNPQVQALENNVTEPKNYDLNIWKHCFAQKY